MIRTLAIALFALMFAIPARAEPIDDEIAALRRQIVAINAIIDQKLAQKAASYTSAAPEQAPHLPNPPTPNCQCGCTKTGSCTCKDCDHPQLTARKVMATPLPCTADLAACNQAAATSSASCGSSASVGRRRIFGGGLFRGRRAGASACGG